MGCWDETCALSNIGITEGQPVVRVRMKLNGISTFPDPDFIFVWENSRPFYNLHDIMDGHYDDYGGLKECDRDEKLEPDTDYDDYFAFFFHKAVWDEAQKLPESIYFVHEIENSHILSKKPRLMEFVKVTRWAIDLRVALSIPPYGPQSSFDSFSPRRKMIKIQQALMKEITAKYE